MYPNIATAVMSCPKSLLLSVFLYLSFTGFAQKNGTGSPVQVLLAAKQPVAVNWQGKLVSIADTPMNTFPQNLLKTKDGLYLFVNGSGRVYQLQQDSAGIQPHRIDSTLFFGYNFNSFPFVYHDTMYSLGGYGMWRINGQLRAYIPQAHSWDIVPLNEEVPLLMQDNDHNMLWYDEKAGKLYIAYSMQRNQAVKKSSLNETTFDYTVRSLDMQTKKWTKEGELSNVFKGKVDLIKNIAFTPWGQLVTFGNKLLLIDYGHNQLLHLSDEKENKIRPLLFQYPTDSLYYCADSVLYFGNISENRLQHLVLHQSDFVISEDAVYTEPQFLLLPILAIIVSICVLSAIIILWRKRSKKIKTDTASFRQQETVDIRNEEPTAPIIHANDVQVSIKTITVFTEKEQRVLQLIMDNSRQNMATPVDELNRLLGLANASVDSQKVQRSKLFTSINKRYSSRKNTDGDLIQSRSQKDDGRYKEYYIAADRLNELEAILAEGVQSF